MKALLRSIVFYSVALYLLPQIVSGVKISGGIPTMVFGGFILTLMFMIFRPILNILAIPLNLATFGMFSFVINAAILYLLTLFVPQITITAFTFPGVTIGGFVVPKMAFNTFFAFVVSSLVLTAIVSFIKWLEIK